MGMTVYTKVRQIPTSLLIIANEKQQIRKFDYTDGTTTPLEPNRGIRIDTGNAALGNFFLEFWMKTSYYINATAGILMTSRTRNTPQNNVLTFMEVL